VAFRQENARQYPGYHNGAVKSFGDRNARLLVVGLAPGLQGANKSGRPFTGDASGELLFATLTALGFTGGTFGNHARDGFVLKDAMVTNAVCCVPPENRPTAAEAANCRPFLISRIAGMARLRVLFALGKVAHDAVLRTFGLRLADHPFGHGALHRLPNGLSLVDSYHCSRYNLNTRRLTADMFTDAFRLAQAETRR
jgi:uracil-DNA glycosylase family 4